MADLPLRARFDALTRAAFAAPLPGGCTVERTDAAGWSAPWEAVRAVCFPGGPLGNGEDVYSAEERAGFAALGKELGSTPLSHHLVIREPDGSAVGVMRGSQRPRADWHMSITALLPRVQGQGIYTELLRRLLPLLAEAGFRQVTSRHHADNNPVLIPKLQAGFLISGFQISPRRGLMVELACPLSPGLRKAYGFRIDSLRGGAG